MKISIVLDTKRKLSSNKYPIKIRLYDKGSEIFIKTDYSCNIENFDKSDEVIFGLTGRFKAEMLEANSSLLSMRSEIISLYQDLDKKGQIITPSRLKEIYTKKDFKTELTLNSCFKSFIASKTGRTAEIYTATLNKIEKYYGNKIYFEDVTFNWLEKLEYNMSIEPIMRGDRIIKNGLDVNARSIHFRNIRAVFNYAINNELIPLNIYPFRRFKIKKEETIKRSVEINKLRAIFNFEGTDSQNWARDIAFIIFGLIGINTKDLYYLSEISTKSVSYKRAKTKRIYTITLEPEIKEVLSKYQTGSELIFKDQIELKSFSMKVNKHLKGICESLGYEKITTYSLRHSWATIAAELDIPKETIGAALGHADKSITNVYINFNQKKIDEANRKVLDYIFKK